MMIICFVSGYFVLLLCFVVGVDVGMGRRFCEEFIFDVVLVLVYG